MDSGGELVYRDRNDAVVSDPQSTEVLVPCPDPMRDTST